MGSRGLSLAQQRLRHLPSLPSSLTSAPPCLPVPQRTAWTGKAGRPCGHAIHGTWHASARGLRSFCASILCSGCSSACTECSHARLRHEHRSTSSRAAASHSITQPGSSHLRFTGANVRYPVLIVSGCFHVSMRVRKCRLRCLRVCITRCACLRMLALLGSAAVVAATGGAAGPARQEHRRRERRDGEEKERDGEEKEREETEKYKVEDAGAAPEDKQKHVSRGVGEQGRDGRRPHLHSHACMSVPAFPHSPARLARQSSGKGGRQR